MEKVFHPDFKKLEPKFDFLIDNFKKSGESVGFGKRNAIKAFDVDGLKINVKSFRKPGLINGLIYGYFRKSKAQRSFEYATMLLSKKIGTPQPFAFYEEKSFLGLQESYYFSLQQDVDGMFQTLIFEENFPNRDEIIRQSAAFFFKIHNEGIEFLDNTAGNTLFKKTGENQYEFYLVDLNRMRFHSELSLEIRIKNLSRLTANAHINEVLSREYAKLYSVSETLFYDKLQKEATAVWEKFNQRRRIKKRLKFWKK
jgi:hypothetical protein